MSACQVPSREKLCLALDMDNRGDVLKVVDELQDLIGYYKVNSAFTLFGPNLIADILERDVKVFLDLKLHDIPNTLASYARAVTQLGVHIVTLHPAGGLEMMRAAVNAADEAARQLGSVRPTMIGIACLTSIDTEILQNQFGVPGSIEDEVRRKATLTAQAGLDGIVCAASEIEVVRAALPEDFRYITPGTRSIGQSYHDHKRSATHAEAIAAGSSLLVIGRPILEAGDRRKAALDVLQEIEGM